MDYKKDLEHALRLADVADKITKRYYLSQDLKVSTKPDSSPVTQADKLTEEALSKIALNEYKESYLGEEGVRESHGNKLWVIDPIDGTKNFMRGMPIWGTLIGLLKDNQRIAAVVSAPALGRRWWAAKGLGAYTKDVDGTERQIHVSKVKTVPDSFILTSSEMQNDWQHIPGKFTTVTKLLQSVWRHRAVGDFLNYMLVAEGAADACFEPGAAQWDIEGPALIVEEAGGSFWSNAKANTPADAPRMPLATNGLLEKDILAALNL